eukprot:gnl/TRDRNA2_/TRDRNA2_62482_c0_seq1.p1 gnl/TRDRNA2_/TRDRNA2_62482_c0~~gnl/TRDRNA2_/TRDRNA2_62482_c0_seq1.p1  ORF type:complete len:431 (-),score=61.07 gnl/TRDRNA2_/TRDRNA2_62482_c0_seq1:64-1335(-)
MMLKVASLGGDLCTIEVSRVHSVLDVKRRIEEVTSIPIVEQKLVHSSTVIPFDANHKFFLSLLPPTKENCWEITLVKRPPSSVAALNDLAELMAHPDVFGLGAVMGTFHDDLLLEYVQQLGPTILADSEVMMQAATYGPCLQYAADDLRADTGFMLAALKKDLTGRAFLFVADELRTNKAFIFDAIEVEPSVMGLLGFEHRNDRDFVGEAIARSRGRVFQFISSVLRADTDVVLEAVRFNPEAFSHASAALRRDKGFVLRVVEMQGHALSYAHAKLKSDADVVLKAVEADGSALEHAATKLKKSRDFVLAAVKLDGIALSFASRCLRSDRELVLEAVRRGHALSDVVGDLQEQGSSLLARRLCSDRTILIAAARNGESLADTGVPVRLRTDAWVLRASGHLARRIKCWHHKQKSQKCSTASRC